jgi:hypothetical protein
MTEVEIFKQSLDVSRIAMIITVIMTVISVTFSALNLAFQRSHDRKSVKPLCYINRKKQEGRFSILIENAGLGPMIIKSISIVEDEQRVIDLNAYLEDVLGPGEESIVLLDSENLVIPASGNKAVFTIDEDKGNAKNAIREIADGLGKVKIRINYKDIYDKKYVVES